MAGKTTITTTGVLFINGTQVENTFTNISKITRKLEGELKKLPIGTKEFIDKANEVKQARARFEEVKKEITAVSSTLDKSSGFLGLFKDGLLKVGDTMKEVFTANLFERALDGIINKGKETVDQLLKIADAMTDVQKTSGMSLEQVKELWDAFDEMDTRTGKLDRLKIAEVGGRLGVPIEEMKSFVQEVDKAYVALGDSFEGGLEGVVDQLGKIKGLFEDTKGMTYAESINRVGSALNTLAAQGTASEGNIAQYALRVGALPDALKPAIDKVLGLGAAFEEAGIDSQIAASGTSNFLTTAAENIEAFAYAMHLSVDQAKELINTKPEEFLLRFAEGMKGLPADQTAKIFASLKLNSLEVQKVIGAAANKTDDFRRAMKTAGEEMGKMTSLQEEFNQKNNNAPAILEKIKNAWSDIFTSTNVLNKFEWLVQLIGYLTGVTSEAGDGIIVFKERLVFLWNIIKVIVAALLSYNTVVLITTIATGNLTKATWLSIVADKAQAVAILAKNIVLLAYEVILGVVTGNLWRARAAMIAFNTATKMNAIGVLMAVVVAVVVAYRSFSAEVSEATKKQRLFNEVNATAQKAVIDQRLELEKHLKIAKSDTATKLEKLEAIKKINEISPYYLGNITLENVKTKEATESVKKYITALNAKAMAEALSAKRAELMKKQIDIQSQSVDPGWQNMGGVGTWTEQKLNKGNLKREMTNEEAMYIDSLTKTVDIERELSKYVPLVSSAYRDRRDELKENFKGFSSLNEIQKKFDKQNNFVDPNTPTGPTNIAAPEKIKKNREADQSANDLEKSKDAYNKALAAKTEADKKLLEEERLFQDEKTKIIEENRAKEIDAENTDFERKKQDIQQQNTEIKNQIKTANAEIDKLERDKKETKNPEASKNYDNAIGEIQKANNVRQNLIKINNQIEEQMAQTHGFNILKINEKWDTADFQRAFEKEQSLIEKQRQRDEEEIINIDSLAQARALLKDNEYLKLTDQELSGIATLEDAKAALREAADRKMIQAQLVSFEASRKQLADHIASMADGPEKEALLKNLDEMTAKITGLKSAMKGGQDQDAAKKVQEQTEQKGTVDILGFSASQWEESFKNLDTTAGKVEAAKMAVQALSNAFSAFAQLQQALNAKEMSRFEKNQNKKKTELKKQLDEGWLTQEEYNKNLQLLEAQTANKKAEMEYKAAKAQKTQQLASAVSGTALGVIGALTMQPWTWANIAAAAIVGTMGAVNIATIASQPLPDKPTFADGGFTGGGFGVPDDTGYKPAGIVHENEWVAPEWMLQEPRTAKVIDYLESVRIGRTRPMAEGGFGNDATSRNSASSHSSASSGNDHQMIQVLTELKTVLKKIKDEGIIAYILKTAKNGKEVKEMVEMYTDLRNKNKHG